MYSVRTILIISRRWGCPQSTIIFKSLISKWTRKRLLTSSVINSQGMQVVKGEHRNIGVVINEKLFWICKMRLMGYIKQENHTPIAKIDVGWHLMQWKSQGYASISPINTWTYLYCWSVHGWQSGHWNWELSLLYIIWRVKLAKTFLGICVRCKDGDLYVSDQVIAINGHAGGERSQHRA